MATARELRDQSQQTILQRNQAVLTAIGEDKMMAIANRLAADAVDEALSFGERQTAVKNLMGILDRARGVVIEMSNVLAASEAAAEEAAAIAARREEPTEPPPPATQPPATPPPSPGR
jgi:hypothetical protein